MEPRVGVEPTTCRLRIERFSSISFAVYACPSLSFAPFRPRFPASCATVCAMLVVGQFPITAFTKRLPRKANQRGGFSVRRKLSEPRQTC